MKGRGRAPAITQRGHTRLVQRANGRLALFFGTQLAPWPVALRPGLRGLSAPGQTFAESIREGA